MHRRPSTIEATPKKETATPELVRPLQPSLHLVKLASFQRREPMGCYILLPAKMAFASGAGVPA